MNYLVRIARNKTKTNHVNILKKWYQAEEVNFPQKSIEKSQRRTLLNGWIVWTINTPVNIDQNLDQGQRRQLRQLLKDLRERLEESQDDYHD